MHRKGPTSYSVACSPQAWAAAALCLLLQACLGFSIDAAGRRLTIRGASLPALLEHVTITNLAVTPEASLDLRFERHAEDVSVTVLRHDPGIEVMIVKQRDRLTEAE